MSNPQVKVVTISQRKVNGVPGLREALYLASSARDTTAGARSVAYHLEPPTTRNFKRLVDLLSSPLAEWQPQTRKFAAEVLEQVAGVPSSKPAEQLNERGKTRAKPKKNFKLSPGQERFLQALSKYTTLPASLPRTAERITLSPDDATALLPHIAQHEGLNPGVIKRICKKLEAVANDLARAPLQAARTSPLPSIVAAEVTEGLETELETEVEPELETAPEVTEELPAAIPPAVRLATEPALHGAIPPRLHEIRAIMQCRQVQNVRQGGGQKYGLWFEAHTLNELPRHIVAELMGSYLSVFDDRGEITNPADLPTRGWHGIVIGVTFEELAELKQILVMDCNNWGLPSEMVDSFQTRVDSLFEYDSCKRRDAFIEWHCKKENDPVSYRVLNATPLLDTRTPRRGQPRRAAKS